MSDKEIPVAKPDVGAQEFEQIKEAVDSGWIGLGPKVEAFESKFGEKFGFDHVIATDSCTHALELALKAADLDGDTVIVPPITWVSTAFSAVYNDYDVEWADVNEQTLCMNPQSLRERIDDDTAAVVVVHYGGQPAEIAEIVEIAHEHDALVIEDCAHAVGSEYDGSPIGTVGDVGCFSFQATKPLTTGEGGALATNDPELAQRVRRLSKLGVDKSTYERSRGEEYSWYYEVTDVGQKYYMHDVSAAIGLAQLDRYDDLVAKRRELAAVYRDGFESVDWVEPLAKKPHTTHTYYHFIVRVPEADRDALIEYMEERGVSATVHYMPLYKHPVFEDHDPELPTTERVWKQIVTLPMSSTFEREDVETVVEVVKSYRDE